MMTFNQQKNDKAGELSRENGMIDGYNPTIHADCHEDRYQCIV